MLLFASSDRAREAFKEKVNSVAYIKAERVRVSCVCIVSVIEWYAHSMDKFTMII